MVSTVNAFIEEPSKEAIQRWKGLRDDYSPEYLSADERKEFDELMKMYEMVKMTLPTTTREEEVDHIDNQEDQ